MKKNNNKIIKSISLLAGIFAALKFIAEEKNKDINKDNLCIKEIALKDVSAMSIYERIIKKVLDRILSFFALIILSPILALISMAIVIDDPGPIFFVQKRVGKNKNFFSLHKFRSMKSSTPHDVPTHQLSNPEQYITKVGRVLRKTSLDELPQIWDIFRGKMSIIGPRPALWNQEDLVEERDKYDANSVLPGLTGWAQINGRDELEILEKARLDGEYVRWLRKGGITAFSKDIYCFFRTISSVLMSEGVVEGRISEEKAHDYTNLDDIDTKPGKLKRILITGADSYIGGSLKTYLEQDERHYSVTILDTIGLEPRPEMFNSYDTVFNVAGIAHTKETDKNRSLYYSINRDLVIKIAAAAKSGGVKQFILLSSMSVYEGANGYISKKSIPNPTSAYGKSKLQADEAIEKLADQDFKVVFLRPPMVYGKGCKGNYQRLCSFVTRFPIFPEYKNKRSMIYIGNLCEFVKRVIDLECSGLFFPQNAEYVNTSNMVKLIAQENGKEMITTPIFKLFIKLAPFKVIKKIFGNLVYEKVDTVSKYSFEESIRISEEK